MIKLKDIVVLPSGKQGTVIELANKVGKDGTQAIIVKLPTGKVATTVKSVTKIKIL